MTILFENANGFGHRQSARRNSPRSRSALSSSALIGVTLTYDIDMTERIVVVGGGIIGLATAYRLTERSPARMSRYSKKKGRSVDIRAATTAACCTPALLQTRFREKRGWR